MSEQRCGTCKWWAGNKAAYRGERIDEEDCLFPYSRLKLVIPASLKDAMGLVLMRKNQGRTCPTWKATP